MRVRAVADIRRRVRFAFRIPRAERYRLLSALGREYLSNAAGSEPKSNQSILNIASSLIWTEGLFPTGITPSRASG